MTRFVHSIKFSPTLLATLISRAPLHDSLAQQPATANKSVPTQHFDIMSVNQAKEYPPPPNTIFKPSNGFVFVVIKFAPVQAKTLKDFVEKEDGVLVDSLGEKHHAGYIALAGGTAVPLPHIHDSAPGQHTLPKFEILVFDMKEGATPKQMITKQSIVDLPAEQ